MTTSYHPPQKILAKYADVLVNFALNSGKGVKPGEVVECVVPDIAKDLALELQNSLLKSQAHPLIRLLPTGFDKSFYQLADSDQLKFFPKRYLQERVRLIDHQIGIIADADPHELSEIEPEKIINSRDAKKKYRDWLINKEQHGKFTWTLALWGVQAKADEVGLSLEDYWQQIIKACFLDEVNPVKHWQELFTLQHQIKDKINALDIDYLEVKGEDADLKVKLGPDRVWKMGGGRNIPSFECFTSPDWRGTQGWIKFNQPLYRYGNVLKDIYLRFEKGRIVEARAKQGQKFLDQMLKSPNADKIGEYSLTDKRMSRITHTMAETLFDENIGGPFGNTHLAVGMAYRDCFRGDQSKLKTADWKKRGFNHSAEHTDIISTTDRTVTAVLANQTKKVIYQDGMFTL